MKGSLQGIFLGIILLMFCLALSIATPDIFSFSSDVEELIQGGLVALGIFGLVIGIVK